MFFISALITIGILYAKRTHAVYACTVMAEGEGETAPTGSTSYIDSTSSSESEDCDREVTSIFDVSKAPNVSKHKMEGFESLVWKR